MFDVIWSYWASFATTYIKPFHDEILALATFVVATFTIILAWVARRQVKDTRILQRAYLSVKPAGIHMLRNRNEAVAHVEICNAGNLPATKVRWFIKHTFSSKGDLDVGKLDARLGEKPGNVIAPHSKMRQGGDSIEVSPWGLRVKEDLFLYVWGAVTYKDGFRWRKRTTTFCHRYNCINVTHNLQWGFPAMSGITARDHRYGNSAN